jgi:hypothetical protein
VKRAVREPAAPPDPVQLALAEIEQKLAPHAFMVSVALDEARQHLDAIAAILATLRTPRPAAASRGQANDPR